MKSLNLCWVRICSGVAHFLHKRFEVYRRLCFSTPDFAGSDFSQKETGFSADPDFHCCPQAGGLKLLQLMWNSALQGLGLSTHLSNYRASGTWSGNVPVWRENKTAAFSWCWWCSELAILMAAEIWPSPGSSSQINSGLLSSLVLLPSFFT